MPDDPNTPKNAKWKKFTRILVHVLYITLALMLFVAAILHLGDPSNGLLAVYGIFIAIFLVIIEILYFCRLKKPHKTPRFVKSYLGFLTRVVGRGMFYQLLGLHYLMMSRWGRWWNYIDIISTAFCWTIWLSGLWLVAIAVSAKAYYFADWIEDEEDEGELRLESDDEGGMNIGVPHGQLV